jgi:biotin synthase
MKYHGARRRGRGHRQSLKTGGCPEDCHFCSQSGQFTSPVRSVWLNIPELVRAAKLPRDTGASEFCIVAAVRGPDDKLMEQMREGVAAIRAASTSTSPRRSACCRRAGRRPRRHGRAPLQPQPRGRPLVLPPGGHHPLVGGALGHLPMVKTVRHGAVLRRARRHGRDHRAARRTRRQLGELEPHEVPLNFLNPRPGHALRRPRADGDRPTRLRTIAAFRLALPRTILRYAGGRELTLGDLGTRERAARRHQRGHRRQLPHDAGPRPQGRPRAARRPQDADQGPHGHVLMCARRRSARFRQPGRI